MPIKINKLESARFGIVVANVVDNNAEFTTIDECAREHNVNLLTQRIDVGNLTRLHSLEEAGCRLMDTLVYYEKKLNKLEVTTLPIDGVKYRFAKPYDALAVGNLAQKAFQGYFGHYHADVRLDNSLADAAYVEWAETSTTSVSSTAPVLLAEAGEQIVGFLTSKHQISQKTEIILSAVHPNFQGRRLYKAMVSATVEHAHSIGNKAIFVSTQINNYAVQKAWAQLGFEHVSSLYTLHKWY